MPDIIKEEDLIKPTEPIKSAAPPKLTSNQEKILAAMKEKPELQKVLTCIFRDYPNIIIQTFKFGSAHATQAQKNKLKELHAVKQKMETYIEEVVAEFAGVELD